MSDLVFHMVLFTIAGTVLVMAPLLIGRLVRPNLPTDEKDAIYECGEPTIGSSFIQWDLRFYTIALLFIVFDVEVAFFFPWATLYGGTMQLADSELSPADRAELSKKILNVDKDAGIDPTSLVAPYNRIKTRLNSEQFRSVVKNDLELVVLEAVANKELEASEKLRKKAETIVRQKETNELDAVATSDEKNEEEDKEVEEELVELVAARLDDAVDNSKLVELADEAGLTSEEIKAHWVSRTEAKRLGILAFSDILVFFGVLLVGFAYVWKRGDLEWVRAAINTSSQKTIPDP